jgi:hypothetical protein
MRPEERKHIIDVLVRLIRGRCASLGISLAELSHRAGVAETKLRGEDGLSFLEFQRIRDELWPDTPLHEIYSLLLPPFETPAQLSHELRQVCTELLKLDGAYPIFLVLDDKEE